MKIDSDQLKNLADKMEIELDYNEIEKLEQAINKLTDKLDKIFDEDVNEQVPVRTSAKNIQVFDEPTDFSKIETKEKEDQDLSLNNFKDGKLVIRKKEENDN